MIACLPNQPISEHFSSGEFACKCGRCSGGWIEPLLVEKLTKLRDALGRRVTIDSGFRCADHNRKEGGARSSLHLVGKAADIVFAPITGHDLYEAIRLAMQIGFGGIGIRARELHLDIRPYSCVWTYGDK